MSITYLKGDATRPQEPGPKLLVHICNTVGRWGAGFVLSISKRWSEPEIQYRNWFRGNYGFRGNYDDKMVTTSGSFALGEIQIVKVSDDLAVVNMIAQESVCNFGASLIPPIRYEALRTCLGQVAAHAKYSNASVHMPKIGTGLAGGDWAVIEPIIQEQLRDIPVFVYEYGR